MISEGWIDTHQHFFPPFYAKWLKSRDLAQGLPSQVWDLNQALDAMAQNDISKAVLSIAPPKIDWGADAASKRMARQLNVFSADIVAETPEQFGFFATLTLPNLDSAIAEARYAIDTLKADGVILPSTVRDISIGDLQWAPLMEYLNFSRAVVLIHPTRLSCFEVKNRAASSRDYLFDITCAGLHIARLGYLEQYPDIRFILSHAGGFLPFIAKQKAHLLSSNHSSALGMERLRQFYFDTAPTIDANILPALFTFADPAHIMFGSDWPMASQDPSKQFWHVLDETSLTDEQHDAIVRGNALRLFPRITL